MRQGPARGGERGSATAEYAAGVIVAVSAAAILLGHGVTEVFADRFWEVWAGLLDAGRWAGPLWPGTRGLW
jgi:hypothetical protein